MKTSLLFLLITVSCLTASDLAAQSVGISNDGSNPDPSAMLDVKSDSKGLLIPRMTTAKRTAISAPADGLMVYDTDTKSMWYFKLNTWTEVGGLALPYNKNVSVNGNALALTNGYAGGNAIVGQAFDGAGISGYSQSGAGGVFSSQSGPGIRTVGSGAEINGKIKIADGTQASDRVLTSDASGVASWKPLPTAKTAMTSLFDTAPETYVVLTENNHNLLPFVAHPTRPEYGNYGYDGGTNFNDATHEYVVPADGLYRTSFKLYFRPTSQSTTFTYPSSYYVSVSKVTPYETPNQDDYLLRSWGYEYNTGDTYPAMLSGEASTFFAAGTKLKLLLFYSINGTSENSQLKLYGGRYSFFSIERVE